MKTYIYLIAVILLFCQCKRISRLSSECGKIIEINQLERLKVKDTLLGFSAMTDYNQRFSFDTLNGNFTFLFFKDTPNTVGYTLLLNEEVKNKSLGAKVISKGGNLIVSNEAKLLNLYGIGPNKKLKLTDNVLIKADENKIILKIYKNACEEDIISILNEHTKFP
ncbi:hypothetical protein KLA_07612 [Cellulophaga geojensis KL-A]|uniref:Lipoprotein n=1 Tax=Cellulophaga geojensis KL-A TaxID=1328323 RepID=A0ABN0RPQ3_9FLAO|nr:hypothetical protein [Cellulophaga geojensis]EWH13901.1 hypothetical protein KLA_07612 [Cellulophaga geojensis KL-A]